MSSAYLLLIVFLFLSFCTLNSHSQPDDIRGLNGDSLRKHQAIILQYHHVSNTSPASTSISPTDFIAHLNLIEKMGFDVKPLDYVITQLQNNTPFKKHTLAITFDDGYDSIYLAAYPELKSRNWPFTVFINPQAIDQSHGNAMSWAQLKEMEQNGANIANHSWAHLHLLDRLENESTPQWQQRIRADIAMAQQRLEHKLGPRLPYLAYPYGEFDEALKALVKAEGYIGFAQQSGAINRVSDFQALPRFPASGVYANIKTLTTKLNSLAFPVIRYAPLHEVRRAGDDVPALILVTQPDDIRYQQAQCYFAGNPVSTDAKISNNELTITAQLKGPLPVGRSRYNCTAPSKTSKRYYWFSMPFISAQAPSLP